MVIVQFRFEAFTYFSLERFLCLDLWGQFLFAAITTGAAALSLASWRLAVVDVEASTDVVLELDCSSGGG